MKTFGLLNRGVIDRKALNEDEPGSVNIVFGISESRRGVVVVVGFVGREKVSYGNGVNGVAEFVV